MQGSTGKRAPAPKILDLIRLLPTLWRQPPLALVAAREKYGDIIRLDVGNRLVVHMITRPDYIKQVLQDNHRNYVKMSLYHNHLFKDVLGNGLLTSEGELWVRQRRLIQPVFRHQRLVPLVSVVTEETEALLERWEGYYRRGEPFDLAEEMIELTRKINGRILFGDDIIGDVVDRARRSFSKGSRFIFLTGGLIPSPQRRLFRQQKQILIRTVWSVIRERVENPTDSDDMLNALLHARDRKTGEGMSLEQLRDELLTLVFAGFETTEKALTWSWYLLSQNPGHFDRLARELAGVLAGRLPTFADLPNLGFARRVAREALRLYPPAWVMGRRALEDDELGGYHIPRGSFIVINHFGMHRHPEYWRDPERFDPDRFLPERVASRPRFAYSPFGGGPRLCVGNDLALMEMQLILSTIAQKYRVCVLPGFPVELEPEITLKPRYGLRVTLEAAPRAPEFTPRRPLEV